MDTPDTATRLEPGAEVVDVTDSVNSIAMALRNQCAQARQRYLNMSATDQLEYTTAVLGLLAEAYVWAGEADRMAKLLGIGSVITDRVKGDSFMYGSEQARKNMYTTTETGEA